MADKLREYSTNKFTTDQMGAIVDDLKTTAKYSRRGFERRWYDNNFFDDGFHFRYMSRVQNKIVDLADRANMYAPLRAIPKASRQIRGIANLLIAQDPTPVVYPEKVNKSAYPDLPQIDPQTRQPAVDPETGQPVMTTNPEYKQALELSKDIATKAGHWLQEEFKNQELIEKLALMLILSMKHGVSYLKIWPDSVNEKINTSVRDAFDIYLLGERLDVSESPFAIDTSVKTVSWIKANEMFDPVQVQKISPDNRHASSEIKEAYMAARFGRDRSADSAVTLILNEAFIKEYINKDNIARIKIQEDGARILQNKKDGDPIIRQVFTAGGVWLRDKYLSLPEYPLVDFRMEPGPIYQVPQIERFIPQNKSYDMIVSRLERILHSSNMGILLKQQGQQFQVSNEAGGQVIEYNGVKPDWMGMPQVPAWTFNVLNIMDANMQEQGANVSTNAQVPRGVKANAAIESLKESEYANLAIATRRLKNTVKRISERFLDLADSYFITPQSVSLLEKGEPQYFDIIGATALEYRKMAKIETPDDVVPIKKDYHVEIEIESQLGYTQEGRKASAKELADLILQLAQMQIIPPEAVMIFMQQLLKAYQFGPTGELMESMDKFIQSGAQAGVDDQSLDKIKLAVLEVMKDLAGSEVLPNTNQRVDETKAGVAEVFTDLQGAKQQ